MKRLVTIGLIASSLVPAKTEAGDGQSWKSLIYQKALCASSVFHKGISTGIRAGVKVVAKVTRPVTRFIGQGANSIIEIVSKAIRPAMTKFVFPLPRAYFNYGTSFFAASLCLWSLPYVYQFLRWKGYQYYIGRTIGMDLTAENIDRFYRNQFHTRVDHESKSIYDSLDDRCFSAPSTDPNNKSRDLEFIAAMATDYAESTEALD